MQYEVDYLFDANSGHYMSNVTQVTPKEWFEGDEIPVDGDTDPDDVEAIVAKLADDASQNGYSCFAHAIIDQEDFLKYLLEQIED